MEGIEQRINGLDEAYRTMMDQLKKLSHEKKVIYLGTLNDSLYKFILMLTMNASLSLVAMISELILTF